jgi:gluconokinase
MELYLAMKVPGLRHSAEQVGGLVFFGRMLDKLRLHAQAKLPPDYKHGAGTDLRVCRFLHVEYPAVVQRALAGGTDEEILEWCFANGRRPNDEEIFIFNAFLCKRGWRDNQTEELEQMKRDRGFAHRTDIQTFFDFHKADEAED